MNALHYMRIIARALDYAKDPDPNHWKTINGSHVHLDKNGNYDGGAGSKFNGRHHYGPDWRQKSALMNRLAAALHGGVAKGQAQGQNVVPKATNGGATSGTIKAEKTKALEEKKAKIWAMNERIRKLYKETRKASREHDWSTYHKKRDEYSDAVNEWNRTLHTQLDEIKKLCGELAPMGVPFTSMAWLDIESRIKLSKTAIKELPPKKLQSPLSGEQIWRKLAGGDETKGSCASVALAYIANKHGFDVLDFRGWASQQFFSQGHILRELGKLPGIKARYVDGVSADHIAAELQNIPIGKEYYFITGRHAAIVRRNQNGVEYLEMQSRTHNGWMPFGGSVEDVKDKLVKRFGAAVYGDRMMLIDTDSFKGSQEFEKLVGYLNTKDKQQKKGEHGDVK